MELFQLNRHSLYTTTLIVQTHADLCVAKHIMVCYVVTVLYH